MDHPYLLEREEKVTAAVFDGSVGVQPLIHGKRLGLFCKFFGRAKGVAACGLIPKEHFEVKEAKVKEGNDQRKYIGKGGYFYFPFVKGSKTVKWVGIITERGGGFVN